MDGPNWQSLLEVILHDSDTDCQYLYGLVAGEIRDDPSPFEVPEMMRLYDLFKSYGKSIGHSKAPCHYPAPEPTYAEAGMIIVAVLEWVEEDEYESIRGFFPTEVERQDFLTQARRRADYHTKDYTVYPCTVAAYEAMIEANPPLLEWGPGKLKF